MPPRPSIRTTRRLIRSEKETDKGSGATHYHKPITYGGLSTELRKIILAADLTEHELLGMIAAQLKINNMHLMLGSDEEITEDDIEWP